MWNAGLDEAQAGIKIAERNINTDIQMTLLSSVRYICQIYRWHYSYGRKRRGTKEPLEGHERGEWKSWLKAQHSKNEDMASSSITSWQIDGKTVETVRDFLFLCPKITADGDCSHEIKRCFLLGRKAMTHLDSILKSRDITLLTDVHLVKALVFPLSCMDVRAGL